MFLLDKKPRAFYVFTSLPLDPFVGYEAHADWPRRMECQGGGCGAWHVAMEVWGDTCPYPFGLVYIWFVSLMSQFQNRSFRFQRHPRSQLLDLFLWLTFCCEHDRTAVLRHACWEPWFCGLRSLMALPVPHFLKHIFC